MQDQNIFNLIAVRCDNKTLEKLALLSLWPQIRELALNEHFWFLRVQYKLRVTLNWEVGTWKRAYCDLLKRALSLSYLTAAKIALQLGLLKNPELDLVRGCRGGDVEVVKLLIERYPPEVAERIDTVLINTVDRGHTEVFKLLLSTYPQADPSSDDSYLLELAAARGHASIVKLLLQDPRVDPSKMKRDGFLWFGATCNSGHTEVVRLLLEDKRLNIQEHGGIMALRHACNRGHSEILNLFIADGRIKPWSNLIITPSYCGETEVVKILLEQEGINPAVDSNAALKNASAKGHLNIVELLLRHPRVNPSATESMAFRRACGNGHLKVAQLLLKAGVDPAAKNNDALCRAVKQRREDIVSWLLELECVDPVVALPHSIQKGREVMFNLLIRDSRVDLSEVSIQPSWERVISKHIQKELENCLRLNSIREDKIIIQQVMFPEDDYSSFLQFILLKKPSTSDAIDWLFESDDQEVDLAVRSIVGGMKNYSSLQFTVYRAFLLLSEGRSYEDVMKELSKEKEVTRQGITLSSILLSARASMI